MAKAKPKPKKENFDHIDLKDIPLGHLVKDRITGFEGIAISRTVFFNGCVQYQLKPKVDKERKMQDAALFDCQQLEVIGKGISPVEVKAEKKEKKLTGGDMPDAPKFI